MFKKYMKYTKVMIALFTFCAVNFVALGKEEKVKTDVKKEEVKKEKQSETKNKKVQKISEVKEQENSQKQSILKKIDEIKRETLANFKQYDEKDFAVKGFTHKIYYRKSLPIVVYEHNKTKAKVVFQLFNDKVIKRSVDQYFFRAFDPSDRGFVHLCEHCLMDLHDYHEIHNKMPGLELRIITNHLGINFRCSSIGDLNFHTKKVLECLNNPVGLSNPDRFKIEKRRVINEQRNNMHQNFNLDEDKYYPGGIPEEVETVKYEEFKDFFKNYIHPSNMLVLKHISDADPAKIKEYLKLLNDNYLKNFDYKDVKVKYSEKDESLYKRRETKVSNKIFSSNKQLKENSGKFNVNVDFNFDKLNLNSKQRDALSLIFNDNKQLKEDVDKYIKGLGYKSGKFGTDYSFENFFIELNSDDPNLCEQKVVTENIKKIINFLKEKVKILTDEQIFENSNRIERFNENVDDFDFSEQSSNSDEFGVKYYINYKSHYSLDNYIINSFAKNKDVFAHNIFDVNENNEILEDEKSIIKNIKENLNVLDVLERKSPTKIRVKEMIFLPQEEINKLKDEKDFRTVYFAPVELKDYSKNRNVFDLASYILRQYLSDHLGVKNGLIYGELQDNGFKNLDIVGYFYQNTFSENEVTEYIYKNFQKIMKDYKLTENKFKTYKETYKQDIKQYITDIGEFSQIEKIFKKDEESLQSFLDGKEDGFLNKNSNLDQLLKIMSNNPCSDFRYLLWEKLGDSVKVSNDEDKFNNKYQDKDMKITKEMVKDYKKLVFDNYYNLFKYSLNYYKRIINNIDKVNFNDVVKAISSADLIKRDELKKLNKKLKSDFNIKK